MIGRCEGHVETCIVTLAIPDGFEVSFGFSRAKMAALERSIGDPATGSAVRPPLN